MAAPDRKRRHKAQYVQGPAVKRGRAGAPRQLEPGMQGILITCNMNERKCVGEAYSLLGEYGEQLYGPEKVRAPGSAARLLLPSLSPRLKPEPARPPLLAFRAAPSEP